jgi:hypothetical protein
MGVSPNEGNMIFYIMDMDYLCTFDDVTAQDMVQQGHKIIQTCETPIQPLVDILEQHIGDQEIDFMSVDTEGYDLQVLQSNDWDKFAPGFVILESRTYNLHGEMQKLNNTFDPLFIQRGYQKIYDNSLNTIYLHKAYANKHNILV